MFNTSVMLNLLADGASRVGEFIPTNTDSYNNARYLTWRDLELWIHPSDSIEGFTIPAVILSK